MKGSEFAAKLPRGYSAERDEMIFEAVKSGHAVPPVWVPLGMGWNDAEQWVTVFVMQHALQIGETPEDGLVVNVSPVTAQRLADLPWPSAGDPSIDGDPEQPALLPTTKIIDDAWLISGAYDARLPPHPQSPGNSTAKMVANSDWVLQQTAMRRAAAPKTLTEYGKGLMIFGVNAGKHYPLTNKTIGKKDGAGIPKVANYGWFGGDSTHKSASGLRCWQPLGTAHNIHFCDYSQIVWLVHGTALVDYAHVPLADLLVDEKFAPLLSDEGWLRTTRLPGTHVDLGERDTEPPPAAEPKTVSIPAPPKVPTVTFKLEPRVTDRWKLHYGAAITQTLAPRVGSPVDQVKAWQRYVGVADDGDFWKLTEKATRDRQKQLFLPATGIVDQATVERAADAMPAATEDDEEYVLVEWIPAKNFTVAKRARGDIYWLVIHTMEAPEKPTTAEAVAHWFGGPNAPRASAHFCIDNDSIVQCVDLNHVAWAAPGANRYGIQYELAGYAKQSGDDWDDGFSRAQLELVAALLARHAVTYDIPIRKVTVDDLKQARALYKAGKPVPRELWGICGHHDTSQAWKLSTHYDPGPKFPWVTFVEEVNQYKRQLLAEQ